ncbi:MAG: hypothetical protein JST01_20235, partial [Cyanobacteria bacterium SZAS TMP-1]|nr:hypothetical protein [Cyanobacteria bacterium SZAS TMP-1]
MPLPTACWAVAICVLAFGLRCIYIFSLDHLLIQFGDGYCFLAGASKLREFVCTALSAGHLNFLSELPPASPNGMVAMRSIAVADRLMVDGPTFPIYLAVMQWLVGLAPGSLLFDSKAVPMSLVNAFVDSLTCLFVFLGTCRAFGRKAAVLAGALFAIYPASIINTQSCYAEPFGCFVLALWSWLVLAAFSRGTAAVYSRPPLMIVLGIVTGVLTLTRPPFVSLPFVFAALMLILRFWQRQKENRLELSLLKPLLPLFLGLALVFLPWLAFTHQATGKFTLFVNRVPAFNLYLGNQLHRDGWRAYPFPEDIPETVPAAVKQIMSQATAEPGRFLSMELRKIPRLWSGVWNEFQYSLFGIPVRAQEVFHQVLLGLAAIGLLLLITKRETLKEMDAAVSYGVAVLAVQSLYLAFEPISRYTMTAMPVIFMLAGYLLAQLSAKPKALAGCLAVLVATVAALQMDSSVIAWCASVAGDAAVSLAAPAISLILLLLAFLMLNTILRKSEFGSRAFSLLLAGAFVVLGGLKVVCITGNPEMREWKATLTSPDQLVRQEIVLPAANLDDKPGGTAYILLDIDQGSPAPLAVSLNGVKFEAVPLPWLQLRPNMDFIDVLTLQEKAMGVSLYSYRQWWVLPVPPSLLKYGARNTVMISPADSAPLTVYGDYGVSDSARAFLPSLQLASWTKTFCTYDHYDARIYEAMDTAKVRSSCRSGQDDHVWTDDDLSSEPGKQSGQYRIRLLTLAGGGADASHQGLSFAPEEPPSTVLSIAPEREIVGGDIAGMQVASSDIKLSSPADPKLVRRPIDFEFSCEVAAPKSGGSAFVGLEFQGKDSQGAVKKWTSLWQPAEIKTGKDWMRVYFSDCIPADFAGLQDLKATV